MYDYSGLNKKLKEKGLKKSYLSEALGISSRTIAKIAKNEKIADNVLHRLCVFFACDKKDLVVEVSSNSVLRALREEKAAKISGGLYHETQVRLTYNSNRIEGSRLTEDQTRLIFETRTIGADYTLPRTKSTEQSKTSASLMILSSDGSYLPRFQSKNRAFEIFVCV